MSMKSALQEDGPKVFDRQSPCWWSLWARLGVPVTVFEAPPSLLYSLIPNTTLRVVRFGMSISTVLGLLIQSPWGKRSGAHMNPAITIAFLRLEKIHPWDALFYVLV